MVRRCAGCPRMGDEYPRCPKTGYRFCSVECHEEIHRRLSFQVV